MATTRIEKKTSKFRKVGTLWKTPVYIKVGTKGLYFPTAKNSKVKGMFLFAKTTR